MAKRFGTDHHKIHIGTDELVPAMSEPMVSHDCIAFYLLSREVSKHVKVVQSDQGADEILAGYDWYPPLEQMARHETSSAYQQVFFYRSHDAVGALLNQAYALAEDPSWKFVRRHQSRPGPRRSSMRRCASTPRSCSSTTRSNGSTR